MELCPPFIWCLQKDCFSQGEEEEKRNSQLAIQKVSLVLWLILDRQSRGTAVALEDTAVASCDTAVASGTR